MYARLVFSSECSRSCPKSPSRSPPTGPTPAGRAELQRARLRDEGRRTEKLCRQLKHIDGVSLALQRVPSTLDRMRCDRSDQPDVVKLKDARCLWTVLLCCC